MIVIRPASAEDLAAVLAIERAAPTAPHWPPSEYAAILTASSPVRRCFLTAFVPQNDRPIGFLIARILDQEVELETIVVDPESRKKGVGTALCNALIDWARLQGATHIHLEVRATSTHIIRLYQHLGWVPCGRRTSYYRDPTDDAVLMRLRLST